MTNHKLKLITTQDGSHSLLRVDMNETYHSFHGARTESLYVFIEKCLDYVISEKSLSEVSIFEVGLGTGLNAFLAALFAEEKRIKVNFHSVEPFPVPADIYNELNFASAESEKALLGTIHSSEWEQQIQLSEYFSLRKCETTLEAFSVVQSYDMIFFDAFAPSKQAEVWELSNIQKCYELLKTGGVLTTYCAQGQFKRNLAATGFEVETLKGAMGKKEMVRAHKLN